MADETSRTSATLLDWLRDPANRTAWGTFANLYEGRIRQWCLRRGLQDADADEVCQQLLSDIHARIRRLEYDPSRGRFRDWLRTVTRNACNNYLARAPSRRFRELVEDIPTRHELEEEIDGEIQIELLRTAMQSVRSRISDRDWSIFQQLVFADRPGAVVAHELGMKVTAVYMVKHRVLEKLREELRRIGCGDEGWEAGP